MIEKIEALSKTKSGQQLTMLTCISILLTMAFRGLYVRINATGWQDFPAVMLDYFAIIGGTLLTGLAFAGIFGIVKIFRDGNKDEPVRSG